MGRVLFIITTIVLLVNSIDAQNIDRLYSVYSNSKSSSRVISANVLLKTIYEKGASDTLVSFNKKSDVIKMDAYVHKAFADWLFYESRYDEAVKIALIATRASEKIGDKECTGNCYSLLCVAYQRLEPYTTVKDVMTWTRKVGIKRI